MTLCASSRTDGDVSSRRSRLPSFFRPATSSSTMAEAEGSTWPTSSVMKDRSNMGRVSMSPLRPRPSAFAEISSPLRHRRSSTFSDSVDDARQSIKSSTDDLLLPRARGTSLASQCEPSHWHSMPLALALLPALGGVLFQNGSAIVTDIILLGLAVVFLNWAVRVPWWVKRSVLPRPLQFALNTK